MTEDTQSDQQRVPLWAERILTARRFLILEGAFAAVFVGAWVFSNPTTGRIVAGCLIAAGWIAASAMSRRFIRRQVIRMRDSEHRVGVSNSARRFIWIIFAVVVVIGLWFGVQSGLG